MMKKKVVFISAGPGDPDLITIKAINHLKKSEIVLVDRLVSPEIVRKFSSTKRKFIFVGKNSIKKTSFSQEKINKLLIQYALKGKYVVRLKGGDVSIFSNITDELMELKKYNISYEIVPGVTSAIGAAAYAGIPLTARGFSSSVRFITLHDTDSIHFSQWIDFMKTKDTLVFYMCIQNAYEIVDKLTKSTNCTNKPIAIIEQATTPMQKVYISHLYDCKSIIKKKHYFISPSLMIVGKIVVLHHYFKWFLNSNLLDKKSYFK
jgi:uroporphyrin-III C-methyltransferase